MPQVPEIQYARNGDVSLAYQVVGEGPIDLVLPSGVREQHRDRVGEPALRAVPAAARVLLAPDFHGPARHRPVGPPLAVGPAAARGADGRPPRRPGRRRRRAAGALRLLRRRVPVRPLHRDVPGSRQRARAVRGGRIGSGVRRLPVAVGRGRVGRLPARARRRVGHAGVRGADRPRVPARDGGGRAARWPGGRASCGRRPARTPPRRSSACGTRSTSVRSCRRSRCRRSSCIAPTTRSRSSRPGATWRSGFPAPGSSSFRRRHRPLDRDPGRRPRRGRAVSSRAGGTPPTRPGAGHRPVHRHRRLHRAGGRAGRPRAGASCWPRTTSASAPSSSASAAARSTRRATASSPRSTGPRAPSAARRRSPRASASSGSRSAPASTPARSSSSATTSAAWRCTSAPGSARSPARRGPRVEHRQGPGRRLGPRVRGPRRARAQGCAGPLAVVPRRA